MMPSLKRGATFSVNSARARVDSPNHRPIPGRLRVLKNSSAGKRRSRRSRPVASSQVGISSTWSLVGDGDDGGDGDCDGTLAGTSANACSEEPKRTENMKMKDQSAYWISVQRSLKIVNGIHCFYFTKVNSGT